MQKIEFLKFQPIKKLDIYIPMPLFLRQVYFFGEALYQCNRYTCYLRRITSDRTHETNVSKASSLKTGCQTGRTGQAHNIHKKEKESNGYLTS